MLMEKGDISSETNPRLLIEFEDLLGHPFAGDQRKSWFSRKVRKPAPNVSEWDIDDLVAKVIIDRSYRMHLEIDVITQGSAEFAVQLAERLDNEQIPARRVWSYQPRVLARRLISMPYVAAVYTPSREHALLYGSKGRLVTPENVVQIGNF
ncbi:hypothetical protein GCM10010149_89080 [Nonomuraea roseoviolacea subsp. roseoviolacea]|uniref:hypothetical protein n=1 Tax=Nonomuraea roseoviolacea TaxID=103837 RepID=UPI0031DC4520